jgi:hypothetical protein
MAMRWYIIPLTAVFSALLGADGFYAAAKNPDMKGYQKTDRVRCSKGVCQTGTWVKAPLPGRNCIGPTGRDKVNYFCPDK